MKPLFLLLFSLFIFQKSDPFLVEKTWKLFRIDDAKNNLHSNYDKRFTLTFSEKTYSGYYGCNRNYGSYELSNNKINFKHMGATKRYCSEMKTEDFLRGRLTSLFYKITSDTLVLTDRKGFTIKYCTDS